MIEVPWHRELSDSRYYRPNFQIYIHIRKTFSDLILSSVLGAKIDENVKGLTVSCSCFILFLSRKKFFSNFFLPSLLFLSETFDSKRVNLGAQINSIFTFCVFRTQIFAKNNILLVTSSVLLPIVQRISYRYHSSRTAHKRIKVTVVWQSAPNIPLSCCWQHWSNDPNIFVALSSRGTTIEPEWKTYI